MYSINLKGVSGAALKTRLSNFWATHKILRRFSWFRFLRKEIHFLLVIPIPLLSIRCVWLHCHQGFHKSIITCFDYTMNTRIITDIFAQCVDLTECNAYRKLNYSPKGSMTFESFQNTLWKTDHLKVVVNLTYYNRIYRLQVSDLVRLHQVWYCF